MPKIEWVVQHPDGHMGGAEIVVHDRLLIAALIEDDPRGLQVIKEAFQKTTLRALIHLSGGDSADEETIPVLQQRLQALLPNEDLAFTPDLRKEIIQPIPESRPKPAPARILKPQPTWRTRN